MIADSYKAKKEQSKRNLLLPYSLLELFMNFHNDLNFQYMFIYNYSASLSFT